MCNFFHFWKSQCYSGYSDDEFSPPGDPIFFSKSRDTRSYTREIWNQMTKHIVCPLIENRCQHTSINAMLPFLFLPTFYIRHCHMPYVCDTNQWAKLPTEQNKWRYNHSIIAKVHNSCLLQKWLGPLKQHCSHSYIILSTILLVKSRSAETSIYFAQKHQLSYASVLVTYLPVDMLVTSIQSYTPDKHQLAQVSLCNISQMLSIYSTGLKPGWPMAIFLLEMQVEVD